MRKFLLLAKRRHVCIVAMVILCILLFLIVFGPSITLYDPYKMKVSIRLQLPSSAHWFGTDQFGRDVLSRVIIASRLTMGTALCTVLCIALFGILIGSVSGYFSLVGAVLMRIVDAMMAFPSLLIALFLASVMGPGFITVMIAVVMVYTPRMARLVHGITLTISTNTYVDSAKAIGAGKWRTLVKYIILNALSPIIVQCSFLLASTILNIAVLDFLGVGFPPDVPSWGNMIAMSRTYIIRAWWLLLFPAVAISLTVVATNIVGDTLRDALDPRSVSRLSWE